MLLSFVSVFKLVINRARKKKHLEEQNDREEKKNMKEKGCQFKHSK